MILYCDALHALDSRFRLKDESVIVVQSIKYEVQSAFLGTKNYVKSVAKQGKKHLKFCMVAKRNDRGEKTIIHDPIRKDVKECVIAIMLVIILNACMPQEFRVYLLVLRSKMEYMKSNHIIRVLMKMPRYKSYK